MEKIFHGSSIDNCLELASKELDVSKDKLIYKIIEEKKGLFKKTASIAVVVDSEAEGTIANNPQVEAKEGDGTAWVKNGRVHVKDPVASGKAARIVPGKNVIILIDGKHITFETEVFEESNISIEFPEEKSVRNVNIKVSEDNMQAFIDLEFKPQKKYAVLDSEPKSRQIIDASVEKEIWPPAYTKEELKNVLKERNIVFGLIDENLEKCTTTDKVEKLLIASGELTINDEPDSIELKFAVQSVEQKFREDEKGNINFKSIGSIEDVKKGDVIAVRNKGILGHDGKDISGRVIRKKAAASAVLKSGEGCSLKDENTLIADIQGKPCIKNKVFYVYPIHEVRSDVDIKTGNISFSGDINVFGSVKEGMEVNSGNAVSITGDIERAKITSKGDVSVKGSIINSVINAGGEDVVKLAQIQNLTSFEETLKSLIATTEEVKKFNLLGYGTADGAIIKVLIENKFKSLPRICLNILTDAVKDKENNENDELIGFIRGKLLGLGPLSIKNYGELDNVSDLVKSKIEGLKASLAIPVAVSINYCQDSQINSSGDIFIKGLGSLVSELNSNGSVYFTGEKSVIRGGTVKAKEEIKCNIVGSEGGVATRLALSGKGHIYAERAYQNTIFFIENREFRLDIPSKNIHAYIDDSGDLIVDRLKL